ncbi:MAG: hypothetical protein ABEI54_05040 [Candidatus Bipolaricaulia bacterium]
MSSKTWSIVVSLEAKIKVRLEVENGEVVDFALTLIYIPGGKEEPENVILYDSAHGEIDCHRYWKESDIKETKRFQHRSQRGAFRAAYNELKENWEHYLELYKKHKK